MTDPMNTHDVRATWIKAMASGDYDFGKGAWHHVVTDSTGATVFDTFCAVGVLRELAEESGKFDDHDLEIMTEIYEWAGIVDINENNYSPTVRDIVRINDNSKDGFNPVISFIESLPLPEKDTE